MMQKLTVLCALALMLNVSHEAAAQAPTHDPNDVVARVLNYSSFGNDDGSGGAYWYQDSSDKCKYKLFDPTPVGSPEIDLNALDPRNIMFREELTDSGVAYTILQYDIHPLLPGASPYFLKLDVQRLQRGWSLIYNKYCSGTKSVSWSVTSVAVSGETDNDSAPDLWTMPLLGRTDHATLAWTPGALMSDCLHCDIHEMLESHPPAQQSDLAEIAAKVTEVLADLILMAPPDERCMLMADVVANLGGMVLQKSEGDADPSNPRRSHH